MAIESYRAGEKQLAAEERAEHFPGLEIVTRLVPKGANAVGLELPKFLELSFEALQKNSTNNLSYLLTCLAADVERLDIKVDSFDSASNAERGALNELVSEAVARAAEAKTKKRVKRIARILSKAFHEGPKQDYEPERELIDAAIQVADSDASILGVMMRYQGTTVKSAGVADINASNETWKKMLEENKEFRHAHIHVSCARLQAQGLIVRMDRIPTSMDLATNAYSLTEFGVTFCEWSMDADTKQ